jgi:hypothetical protein
MKIILFLLSVLAPWLLSITLSVIQGITLREAVQEFSLYWVFISPLWIAGCMLCSYAMGRVIESVETAKSVINFTNDNKHHVSNVVKYFKNRKSKNKI